MKQDSLNKLRDGIEQLNLKLDNQKIDLLNQYADLLIKWNKAFNLTAIRNEQDVVSKHLLDSLSVWPCLETANVQTLTDVGSGAGLPGIPLAIASPQMLITLVDSNSKKTGFLQQVKTELKLENIQIENARVENLSGYQPHIISRAFTSIKEMFESMQSVITPETVIWAMKGKTPKAEIEELLEWQKNYSVSAPFKTEEVKLKVPGLEGDRCLIKLFKS